MARVDGDPVLSDKSERWAFARIRELQRELTRVRQELLRVRRSRDLWRDRAVRKTVKR